jgi:hypothetical protein
LKPAESIMEQKLNNSSSTLISANINNKVTFKYCNPYAQTDSSNKFSNIGKNRFNNINDSYLNSGNIRNDHAFKISNSNNLKKNITETVNR